jgi:glycosyltransferase involved in cell wall biosynthesis
MRVLHVPAAVGGNPQGLARAEREIGLDSLSVVLDASPFGYPADFVLREPGVGRVAFEARRLRLLWAAMRKFDVVHFNFGRTILPPQLRMLDLPLVRMSGAVIAVTFQGDDARRGDIARELKGGPTLPTSLPHLYSPASDAERRIRVARFERHADLVYYLNPDLAHVLGTRARFLPYAHVDVRTWPLSEQAGGEPPVVVHAPSDRTVKGTRYLVDAVEQLRGEGLEVELVLVEGLSHTDAVRLYGRADLAVDQLFAGWYGGFAVEAMAAGVPVATYLRSEDFGVLPERMREALPLLDVSPDTLADVLRTWLGPRRHELAALGAQSRRFVERWHDPRAIAAGVAADYEAARLAKRHRARSGEIRGRTP